MALCREVENYLDTARGLPFFYAVGDKNYREVLLELQQRGVIVDRVSDFCSKDDKFPNMDNLIDYFRTLDVDCKQNRHVLTGMGEYLALRGSDQAMKELRRLKTVTLGNARLIILLRCVSSQVYELAAEDFRLKQQQRVFVEENAFSSLNIVQEKYDLKNGAAKGVKGLLRELEDGATGTCRVNTGLSFPDAMMSVRSINSAWEAIRSMIPDFSPAEKLGTEAQWDKLAQELVKNQNSLEKVFAKREFDGDFEEDLYENCAGLEFRNWLYFLYLQQNADRIHNAYLRYVLARTERYDELKDRILTEIIQVSRDDAQFQELYEDRKRLVRDFPESEIAIFVQENSIEREESVYRLTDNTLLERKEIIRWVSKHGYVPEIESIYPALHQYLQNYIFDCGKLSEMLTVYFREYRDLKVANHITPEFMDRVMDNAKSPRFTYLQTRDAALQFVEDKQNAFLYWIDALGVEYLPCITELVRKKGLSMHVDITYVQLPTITSVNRSFFDQWPGPLKEKESELDDIKHKGGGGYDFQKDDTPVHLAAELEVIERAIDRAAMELTMHHCKSFVIASDHGASRLAVIRRQEEKYETDTKGEHSGRCCREFPDFDLPWAVRENGFLVLADYGRFKKSRAANVEVHGGASLEEVLVPVITLKLRRQTETVVKVINKDNIAADKSTGTTFTFYISDVENPDAVSVLIRQKRYQAVAEDATHYAVSIPEQKRSRKNISALVYDGEDPVGTLEFDIKGRFRSAEESDFDREFDFK